MGLSVTSTFPSTGSLPRPAVLSKPPASACDTTLAKRVGNGALAAGLFATGLMSHRKDFPRLVKQTAFTPLLPLDSTAWFRVATGMGAIVALNKALRPNREDRERVPLWQSALLATAVMAPLSTGVHTRRLLTKAATQWALISPMVVGTAALSQGLSNRLLALRPEPSGKERNNTLTGPLVRLGVAFGSALFGMAAYGRGLAWLQPRVPKMLGQAIQQSGLLSLKNTLNPHQVKGATTTGTGATGAAVLTALPMCPRCGTPTMVCLTELSEVIGSLWHKLRPGKDPDPQPAMAGGRPPVRVAILATQQPQ